MRSAQNAGWMVMCQSHSKKKNYIQLQRASLIQVNGAEPSTDLARRQDCIIKCSLLMDLTYYQNSCLGQSGYLITATDDSHCYTMDDWQIKQVHLSDKVFLRSFLTFVRTTSTSFILLLQLSKNSSDFILLSGPSFV